MIEHLQSLVVPHTKNVNTIFGSRYVWYASYACRLDATRSIDPPSESEANRGSGHYQRMGQQHQHQQQKQASLLSSRHQRYLGNRDNSRDNVITNKGYDFNKYEVYVAKIRSLFVPSLEPRIYNALEALVYRKDSGTLSSLPYLRKCLDTAATWCYPVYGFNDELENPSGIVEKMLGNTIKYFIKGGLINSFINSMTLNKRLKKVCKDLDDLGIEKDLLSYLAVWNYIKEKDYWIPEDNHEILVDVFDDSRNRNSDLNVEVGSKFRCRKKCKRLGDNFKNRNAFESSEIWHKNDNVSLGNCHMNEPLGSRLESWLSSVEMEHEIMMSRQNSIYCCPNADKTNRVEEENDKKVLIETENLEKEVMEQEINGQELMENEIKVEKSMEKEIKEKNSMGKEIKEKKSMEKEIKEKNSMGKEIKEQKNGETIDIDCNNTFSACPLDCICVNKIRSEDKTVKDDPDPSCDCCDNPDQVTSLNHEQSTILFPLTQDPSKLVVSNKKECFSNTRNNLHPIDNHAKLECIGKYNSPNDTAKKSEDFPNSNDSNLLLYNELEEKQIKADHGSYESFLKPIATQEDEKINDSTINLYPQNNFITSTPLRKPKQETINITIAMCRESVSSMEKPLKKESRGKISSIKNDSEEICCVESKDLALGRREVNCFSKRRKNCFKVRDDAKLSRKNGRDSIESCACRKKTQVTPEKNSKDECRHPQGANASLHSSPRSLESKDHMPSSIEPHSSMRNPILYEMSAMMTTTKSCKSFIDKINRPLKNQEKIQKTNVKNYENNELFERDNRPLKNQEKIQKTNVKNYEKNELFERNNRRCCCHNAIKKRRKIEDKCYEKVEKKCQRTSGKNRFSPFVFHSNLCHAFSSGSIDRVKHLIKRKFRQILLESNKATNTIETILKKEKYRKRYSERKTERSSFENKYCSTIKESSSETESPILIYSQKNRRETLENSSVNSKVVSPIYINSGTSFRDFSFTENIKCDNLTKSTDESTILTRLLKKDDRNYKNYRKKRFQKIYAANFDGNNERLAGGSDISKRRNINSEFNKIRRVKENRFGRNSENTRNRCNYNLNFSDRSRSNLRKRIKHDLREILDCSIDSSICESNSINLIKDNLFDSIYSKKLNDETFEFSRKLDYLSNSTSRHIYLYEYNEFETSNDEESQFLCDEYSNKHSPISGEMLEFEARKRKNSKFSTNQNIPKGSFNEGSNITQNIPEENSDATSKINSTNICQKGGLTNLDEELRSKLSQYVNMCKNVKYSLLKKLRPYDIFKENETT